MAKYTYEQFEQKANDAGLYNKFGQADLDAIRENPDLGVGLLGYKSQYANAKTPEEKNAASQGAQQLRSSLGGYTVDSTGQFAIPTASSDYEDNRINSMIDNLQNSQFSYNPQTDPQFQQYREQYLREGQRAMQNTMAQASAMTGGRPSSYAVTAANQANNYYASQVADKIPELYQQAYQRYMDEFTRQGQIANLRMQQQQNKWNAANAAYAVGDTSKLQALGVNTSNDPKQLERAQLAYQYGDPSLLNKLGIDTSNDLNRQYLQMQIDDATWNRKLQIAQAAAQYGDYSELEYLGFDTSKADFDRNLAIAQLIAQYTGSTQALQELMKGNNVSWPANAGSTGSSGGSGKGGGTPYSSDPGLYDPYEASMYDYKKYGENKDGYPSSTAGYSSAYNNNQKTNTNKPIIDTTGKVNGFF